MEKPLLVGVLRGEVTRSDSRIVHSDLDIKFWLEGPPSIDDLRPARCPCCGAAGAPLGSSINLVGHGVRARGLMGPLGVDDPSTARTIFTRRFRCRICQCVVLVVPRVVVPRRRYAAPAIAGALAKFGARGEPPSVVEAWVRGSARAGIDGRRWRMLDRWVGSVMGGRLFERLNRCAVGLHRTLRASAAAFTHQLAALSRSFHGLIEALAMDGAKMAIGRGAQGNTCPPSASTAG